MSVRREDTASKPDDLQIGSSWIPVTPAKPGSTNRQPICTNWGEHETVEANWLETERLAPTQCQRPPACYTSLSVNNASNWHAGMATNSHVYKENLMGFESWLKKGTANSHVFGKDSSTYDKFSINDPDQWTNISFGNLLRAMGKKAAMENALTHDSFAMSSTSSSCFQPQFEGSLLEDPLERTGFAADPSTISAPYFHPQIEGSQFTMSSGNSSLQDHRNMLGANFDAEVGMPTNTVTDRSSIPARHFLDLNSPPKAITDATLRKSAPYQFEPITPEKTNRGEYQQEPAMKHSSIDAAPTGEKNEISRDGVMQLHEKKEKSHLVSDQLSEVTSTQLQENHKPDKGGTEEADFKTPQQKTRRKKHRPKVIIEGQLKNTPKSSAQKTSVLQETTRAKRKYVRKNGVSSPLGGGTNGTDSDNKTPSSTETPVGKRKYRRRKENSKSEDADKETTETTEIQPPRHTRRSCRRSLNFNSDDPVRDGISSDLPSSNCERELQAENFNAKHQPEAADCTQKTEVIIKNKDMVTSHVCTRSMNQLREDFLSMAEQHPQSCLPHIKKDTLKENHMITNPIVSTRGKCQIVFSDVTHDKEANTVQVSRIPDGQWTPKSPGDSISSDTCLTPEKQIRGLKRQNTDKPVEAALCNRNEKGIMYNTLEEYLSVFTQNADISRPGLHFPAIYKKKRTEKVYSTVTSSMQITAYSGNGVKLERHTLRDSCKNLLTSPTNQGSYGVQSQDTNLLTKHATDGTHNGRQVFEDLLALGPTQRIKRRRSKGPTRQRNLASLLESCKQWPNSPGRATISRTEQNIEILNEPLTCIEALVADTRSTMATKKRSKRSMLINSTVQNLYNHQNIAGTSMGPPLALTWKSMSPVDSITDKLNQLDLNAESRVSEEKYSAFMSYHNYYKERYALVPFQSSGAVIPFDASFDQVRRRKPRPKVDLDDETTRVWKLLLENINSEGIDGTNEDNTKWWEEERRVFIGRADSFIARMHLVQGDRRFSPWKGSVVDSVVGVFLTQNVSDHLSSSAFMSLAARFPVNPMIHSAALHDERSGGEINEPEVCVLESDGDGTFVLTKEILNDTVCGEDTKTLQEFEDDSIREVNSMKPSQNASGNESILEDKLRGQSTDTSLGPVISCEIIAKRSVSSNEDAKDTEDTLSSQTPEISSQNSADSPIAQTTGKNDSCLLSTSEEEPTAGVKPNWSTTSFVRLLEMTDNVLHGTHGEGSDKRKSDEREYVPSENLACSLQNEDRLDNSTVPGKTIASCSQSSLCHVPNSGAQSTEFDLYQRNSKFSDSSSEKELCTAEISELSSESASGTIFQKSTAISFGVQKHPSPIACSSSNEQIEINQKKVDNQRGQAPGQDKMQGVSEKPTYQQNLMDATGSSCNIDNSKHSEHKEVNSNKNGVDNHPGKTVNGPKSKGGRIGKEKENQVDWDQLRKQTPFGGRKRERTVNTLDSVDWDAIRCADVHEIAQTIKERGMNNMLAERIKDFLNRIVRDHGSIDLEWLRDVPPDKAKEYLLSIRGLGLKSVECVRLLTLHHLAFPVDTNVGRIAVRLGWVPLQPLPESLQLHLLELYPVLESIQKYLWPRLCKLDQKTLYELHYQMITFGKVFCTKSKPNCNACPMRAECRHFASAYASARLALPAPPEKSIVSATEGRKADQNPIKSTATLQLPSPQTDEMDLKSRVNNSLPIIEEPQTPEPIIEVPATPEPDYTQAPECDIESAFSDDSDEIPTIQLNMEEFTHNLQTIMQQNMELQEGEMSKALVALTSEAASIPVPKLKNMSRLRTEHHVYELPDSHPLLEGMDKREPDDPSPYLLAIWTPGETMDSIEPPEKRCSSQELEKLCTDETCSSCNSIREAKSQTVRGTLLIPCRTAMRGSFPLNGTYFQVNEVFSDHESSLSPMDIPRKWLWNLPRRTVYFGTSIPTIFKGLSTEGIQYCFWRGFVCVRGFDRKTRAPRPLIARLHFPASKLVKGKGKIDES
ncbi:HhH-GPD base excision DNA repair family protein [Perilla frutescens var. frutescens]|nr:HhH-GPD base excision DNA repair family protein [Perilla frutescens var. frutescens]